MPEKPIEYWIALCAAMLFVIMQHKEKPFWARVAIAGVSGGIGYAVGPEIAASISWLGEAGAVIMTVGLGYGILDTALAIVSDRRTVAEILRSRLGGGK